MCTPCTHTVLDYVHALRMRYGVYVLVHSVLVFGWAADREGMIVEVQFFGPSVHTSVCGSKCACIK